jgi:hypothetical protein
VTAPIGRALRRLSRDNGLSRSWFRKLAQIVGSAAL